MVAYAPTCSASAAFSSESATARTRRPGGPRHLDHHQADATDAVDDDGLAERHARQSDGVHRRHPPAAQQRRVLEGHRLGQRDEVLGGDPMSSAKVPFSVKPSWPVGSVHTWSLPLRHHLQLPQPIML